MDISAVIRHVLGARTGRRPVTPRHACALRRHLMVEVPLRCMVILVLWLAASGQASAQPSPVLPTTVSDADTECPSVSPTSEVVVTTSAGKKIRGTLMCLSANEAWLLRDGRLSKLPSL